MKGEVEQSEAYIRRKKHNVLRDKFKIAQTFWFTLIDGLCF